MTIQIKLKNSVVQNSTPSASDLPEVGEIALNANINSIGGFMRASDNSIVKIFGPGSVSTPTATTTVSGIAELATSAETTTGSATNRVVTPAGLNAVTVAERTTSNNTYLAKAGGTLTGVLAATAGSNSAPAIHFGDSDSGIFGGTNTVSLTAGGTTRLTADTGVNVVGDLAVSGAINCSSNLIIAEKLLHSGDADTFFSFPAANIAAVDTAGSERLRVDATGRLLIGITTPRSPASTTPRLQVEGTDAPTSSISLTRNSASTGGPKLILNKTRGTAVGADTVVVSGDTLGSIIWAGNDGTDSDNEAAEIRTTVDGTPGSNDMPGRLTFRTAADGANTTSERMRIDSAGRVGIGQNTNLGNYDSSADRLVVGDGSADEGITIVSGQSVGHHGSIFFADGTGSTNSKRGQIRYEQNTEAMKFATAGTERVRIDSSGRLLVGRTTGDFPLDVDGAARINGKFYMPNDQRIEWGSSDVSYIQGNDNENLVFGVASERMRLTATGLGLGTTSPNRRLVVAGDTNTVLAVIGATNGTSSIFLGDTGDEDIGAITYNHASNFLTFTTNTSEKLRLDSSGRLMIGVTSTSHASSNADDLCVGNNDSSSEHGITIGSNVAGTIRWADSASGGAGIVEYVHSSNSMNFYTDGTFRMLIASDGDVGINENSPSAKLHVTSADATVAVMERSTTGNTVIEYKNSTASMFAGLSSSATHWGIDDDNNITSAPMFLVQRSTGNVGIGTSDPDNYNLKISGSSADMNLETTSSTSSARLVITGGTGSYSGVHFGDTDDADVGRIRYYHTDNSMRFSTNTAEEVRILSTGGITFNGDTSTNNALDDYEEGTWTPTLKFGGGTSGISYSTIRGGTYTKIGRQVTLNFGIKLSSKGSSSGHAEIHGIPFTAGDLISGTTVENNGVCAFWDNVDPNLYAMFFHTNGDHIEIKVVHDTTDAVDKIVDATESLIFQNDTSIRGSVTYFV